jgi:uncharacterized protein YjbI with pentapeptide repeats
MKKLIDRWSDSKQVVDSKNKIINSLKKGKRLKLSHSPFGDEINDKIDFRGIDILNCTIKKASIRNCDFSYSDFSHTSMERTEIIDSLFYKVKFGDYSEYGNLFIKVIFDKCNFNAAYIGYDGSMFQDCIFENSTFSRALFIRAEFIGCTFKNCKLDGVDFFASSFDSCIFIGIIKNVIFRGGYPYVGDIDNYGKPKKNEMKNVSFSEASLIDVSFRNHCNLSTVILPIEGAYYLFNDYYERYSRVLQILENSELEDKEDAIIYTKVHLMMAQNQNWYILNIENLKRRMNSVLSDFLSVELVK